MRHILLKGAAVVAAVIFGANGSFAANEWSYADGKITKGGWTIAATYTEGESTITLGAIEEVAEDGVLDLRDMVVGDVAITGLSLPTSITSKKGVWASAAITKCYVNHVAGTSVPGAMQGNTTVQEIEFASDTITTLNSQQSFFKFCTALKRCILDCPNLVTWDDRMGSGSPFSSSPVTNKFHEIVNPWVTTLTGNSLFVGLCGTTGPVVLTNLVSCSASVFNGSSIYWNVTDMWIKWPNEYGISLGTTFGAVTNLVLEMPKVRSTGGIRGFTAITQDVSSVVPPYTQKISDYAALRNMNTLYGCLTLTNWVSMTGAAGNSWIGYAFECTGVKAAEFRGPITNIPYRVMTSVLTNLVLQLPNVTNVYKGAFYMANNGEITIYGKPWAENLRTNLLARLDGKNQSKLTLKVSKKQKRDDDGKTWKDYAQDYGDDFPKASAPEGCFGVWREPNGEGTRGAWMVHFPQADDPQAGMCIVIR